LIIHLLTDDAQKATLMHFKDNHWLYGTVLQGTANKGYVVAFDIFPVQCKTCVMIRKHLTTVVEGDEEKEEPARPGHDEQLQHGGVDMKQPDDFLSMELSSLRVATSFDMVIGDGNLDVIKWKILADGEHIKKSEDPLMYPD
jgi:hypothetical protein